jgi:hypothetical protein
MCIFATKRIYSGRLATSADAQQKDAGGDLAAGGFHRFESGVRSLVTRFGFDSDRELFVSMLSPRTQSLSLR